MARCATWPSCSSISSPRSSKSSDRAALVPLSPSRWSTFSTTLSPRGTLAAGPWGRHTSGASQAQGILGLRWRLFDFGRVDAQIAAARGQEAEALAAYRLAVLRAMEEVENSFAALVKREAQVGILTQGESSLARARENSLAAHKGGVVSLIEVLDADGNLLQMRDEKAQAQTEAARAAISSFRALGGGWDARNASSNHYGAALQ